MYKKVLLIILIVMVCVSSSQADAASEVMLMGSFHFDRPGMDAVKVLTTDVMTEENQNYLKELSKKIATFKPTMVLLEFDEKNTKTINQEYHNYLKGQFELPVNEIYQIGFRVAKLAGVKSVASFDERDTHWQGEALFEYLQKNDVKSLKKLQDMIAAITKDMDQMHATLSLREILMVSNSQEYDHINKSFYLLTNDAGATSGDFVGADASASWWHRNFRMYARIQQHAKKHQKIFVLGGQGHTAIIKDFLAMDKNNRHVPVAPLLSN